MGESMTKKIWHGEKSLPAYPKNLAAMLNQNAETFSDKPVYQEVHNGEYIFLLWHQFKNEIIAIQNNLIEKGLRSGDRVAILSPNRKEMLELELAVMSMGAIAVPIFAGYPLITADSLVNFCEPKFVAVADQYQYQKMKTPDNFQLIIHFDSIGKVQAKNAFSFEELLSCSSGEKNITGNNLPSDSVCLMMYTSGTMGKPKCVQLTHNNILSQQAAMRVLWKLSHHDRFLSFLPWHHSFGGIFEKYSAITNGAVLSLENGFGKEIDILLDNWKKVKPTVFYSVPRIYQEIVTQIAQDPEIERLIFHDELRFIFTAAAPLPKNISDIFEKRGIPIYEGWGLTETSPCCTVTDPNVPREPGVVGKPIPGVSLKLADDNEIMVQGPNVMEGYYKNPEETKKVLTNDGWFNTGDVGEFTETGLRLISRKDRIFKLSNAEKVVPTEIENLIVKDCPYLSHAFVSGSSRNYPVILLFPNKKMFTKITDESDARGGCACPEGLPDFAFCLHHCLKKMNESIEVKYSRVKAAMLLDYELSIENEELTPSMKLAPNVVAKVFKANIDYLYGSEESLSDKVYVINLED